MPRAKRELTDCVEHQSQAEIQVVLMVNTGIFATPHVRKPLGLTCATGIQTALFAF